MLKLNMFVLLLVFMAGVLDGCGESMQAKCRRELKEEAEAMAKEWPGWIAIYSPYDNQYLDFEKSVDGYILSVHVPHLTDLTPLGWYYQIAPLDRTKEILTSQPVRFYSYRDAIQNCEVKYKQLIEGEK